MIASKKQYAPLEKSMAGKFNKANPMAPVVNDAIDEDGSFVLFQALLNVPRLIQFANGIKANENARGLVVCFDFQENFMKNYLDERITLRVLDFDKVVRAFVK
jgi:hypothetical protein